MHAFRFGGSRTLTCERFGKTVPFRLDPFREPLHNAAHRASVRPVILTSDQHLPQLEIVTG
jgi:hypothetical protein